MNKSIRFRCATVFVIFITLTGCSRYSTVTIANQSGITLSNVIVSGSGFTNQIGDLAIGAKAQLKVHRLGESGLRMIFESAVRGVDASLQGSFVNDYQISVVVDTNLTVLVQ
jgi:hypothetical protein